MDVGITTTAWVTTSLQITAKYPAKIFYHGACGPLDVSIGDRVTLLYFTDPGHSNVYASVVLVVHMKGSSGYGSFRGWDSEGNDRIGFLSYVVLVEPDSTWDPNT